MIFSWKVSFSCADYSFSTLVFRSARIREFFRRRRSHSEESKNQDLVGKVREFCCVISVAIVDS